MVKYYDMFNYKNNITKYASKWTSYLLVWTSQLVQIRQSMEIAVCSFSRVFGNQRENLFFLVTGFTPYRHCANACTQGAVEGSKQYSLFYERNNTSDK